MEWPPGHKTIEVLIKHYARWIPKPAEQARVPVIAFAEDERLETNRPA